MYLKLNMKDIKKILAKDDFNCKLKKNDAKACLYEAVGSLSVMPSLLFHVL